MGTVIHPAVQRLIARIELVTVTQTETPETELRKTRYVPVAPHIDSKTEYLPDKEHRLHIRLRTQVLRIRHQQRRTDSDVSPEREKRTSSQVLLFAYLIAAPFTHTKRPQHPTRKL